MAKLSFLNPFTPVRFHLTDMSSKQSAWPGRYSNIELMNSKYPLSDSMKFCAGSSISGNRFRKASATLFGIRTP
jgi:hypothetical protein